MRNSPLQNHLLTLTLGQVRIFFKRQKLCCDSKNILIEAKPSLVLVPGDTNSALAGALASVKHGTPVAHLESGARSYDMHMAEEINRRLIDHCSQILFAPTDNCKKNLENESVTGEIYQTGDTMYDVFKNFKDKADQNDIMDKLSLADKEYAVLTTHRAENVDDPSKLKNMLQAYKQV